MPRPAVRVVRRRSFTIVELLVVIAIISILIAILLPVLNRARRRFLVLACPIAYVGEDGGLYLVSANGNAELRLSDPGLVITSRGGLEAPMQWSPSGRLLAFNAYDRNSGSSWLMFMEPMSGQTWKHQGQRFGGFVDDDTWLESGAWGHRVCSVQTGMPVSNFRLPDDRHYDAFGPVPPNAGGIAVASWHGYVRPYIGLVKKDFQPGRPIYTYPPSMWGQHIHSNPSVDPLGEWAAWQGPNGSVGVFVRSFHDQPTAPLETVVPPVELTDPVFCDWTEDSQLLVNCRRAHVAPELVILKLDGSLVRKVSTTVRPMATSLAAYRKYGHR